MEGGGLMGGGMEGGELVAGCCGWEQTPTFPAEFVASNHSFYLHNSMNHHTTHTT